MDLHSIVQSAVSSLMRPVLHCVTGLLVTLLVACTPTLDWRTNTINSQAARITVLFPGKISQAQKTVTFPLPDATASLPGLTARPLTHILTLHAAQADSAQFALGTIATQDAQQAQHIASALALAFASHMGGELKRVPVTVPLALGAFDVTYPASANRYAQARFIWRQHAAYELLTVGHPNDLNPETAAMFIDSLRFE